MIRVGAVVLASTILLAVAAPHLAKAASYPAKPVRLVVPSAAGSPPDVRARWLAERLQPALGQPIVVDNRPGAGGILGTRAGARSSPDGYTLIMVHQGTVALNPHLYPDLPYQPLRDLSPVSGLAITPLLLAVNPELPVNSVAELIALAKREPGTLNFGSPGSGTPPHLAAELFRHLARIDVVHVPYKSAPAAQVDLIAGLLSYTFGSTSTELPQVRAGRIKALAVTSNTRLSAAPEIPTMAESGLQGYEYWSWMGLCVPAGTPGEIVSRLNSEIGKILRSREARDWFEKQGGQPMNDTPEQFGEFMRKEYARWGDIIRAAHIKLD